MSDVKERLAVLIDEGLTFGDCVTAFAARRTPDELRYVALAKDLARDGELEIDDDAIVSGSSDAGDYVMAWVWVDDPESEDDDGPLDDEPFDMSGSTPGVDR